MNIRTGDVHLTIVSGGPSAQTEKAESPTTLRARVSAVVDHYGDYGLDEAVCLVGRFEDWVGREISPDEMMDLFDHANHVKWQAERLQDMILGKGVFVMRRERGRRGEWVYGADDVFVERGSAHSDDLRAQYEAQQADRRVSA